MTARDAPADLASTRDGRGYGRARLWLGVTAVGTMVVLATLGLPLDTPARAESLFGSGPTAEVLRLLAFVLAYAMLHAPFDLLGGYLLPRRHGRAHPPLPRFVGTLVRGVTVQSAALLVVAVVLMIAGRAGGAPGVVGAGVVVSLLLLAARGPLARAMAPLRPAGAADAGRVPTACIASDDEGFTGGLVGVFTPRRSVLPARWRETLGRPGFRLAVRRRDAVVESGSWRRGRVVALGFTWIGLALAALLVGGDALGTARGTIELSLLFTLWSFFGLLVLPTLSRSGVAEVDERLRASEPDAALLEETVDRLDALQDAEPERPSIVEAIFHPIPSVRNRRVVTSSARRVLGGWDAARSAVYLSAAGLGLLGRAVHCNCGRPALWVFLPTD